MMNETITTGLEKSLALFENKIELLRQLHHTSQESMKNYQLIMESLKEKLGEDLGFTAILELSEDCDINVVIDNHKTKRRLDLDFKGSFVSITQISEKQTKVQEYLGVTPINTPQLQIFTTWIAE